MTKQKKPSLVVDVNLEEAAEETERDQRALNQLKRDHDELRAHAETMLVGAAVQRLVDVENIDLIVIAKTLLIGDRSGTTMYKLAARTHALAEQEGRARDQIWLAIRDASALDVVVHTMVAGAVFLATQSAVLDRQLLRGLAFAAERRASRADRAGYGAIDLVDNEGVRSRAWLLEMIEHARQPAHAAMTMTRGGK